MDYLVRLTLFGLVSIVWFGLLFLVWSALLVKTALFGLVCIIGLVSIVLLGRQRFGWQFYCFVCLALFGLFVIVWFLWYCLVCLALFGLVSII